VATEAIRQFHAHQSDQVGSHISSVKLPRHQANIKPGRADPSRPAHARLQPGRQVRSCPSAVVDLEVCG
jgi:hypothetical protein